MQFRRIFPLTPMGARLPRPRLPLAAIGLTVSLLSVGLGPLAWADGGVTPATPSQVSSGVYQISTPGQLLGFDQGINDGSLSASATYELGATIDMTGVTNWAPITGFTGTFNGEGYAITNLAITASSAGTYDSASYQDGGLFGDVEGATLENLTMDQVTVSASSSTATVNLGTLVGLATGSSTISDVTVTGADVVYTGSHAVLQGGIVGYLDGSTLSDSSVAGTVGSASQSVTSSSYEVYSGGLAGYADAATLTTDSSAASVDTGDNYYDYGGGLIGYGESDSISESSASGTVTGMSNDYLYLGGVEGYAYEESFAHDSATGAVTATGSDFYSYLGGFTGYSYDSAYVNVSAAGTVTGGNANEGNNGGLIGYGYEDTLIQNAVASGAVSGSGTDYVSNGGLIGETYEEASVTDVEATGAVSGGGEYPYLGGLIGYSEYDKSITNAFATGSVSATGTGDNYIGGLIGETYGGSSYPEKISNAYATGAVQGSGGYTYAGGAIGEDYYTYLTDVYTTGTVSGSGDTGGFTGYDDGENTYTADYWDTTSSGLTTDNSASNAVTGETATNMMKADTFSGWDFTATWGIVAGQSMPYLLALPLVESTTLPAATLGIAYSTTLSTSSALPTGVSLGATSSNLPAGLALSVPNGTITLSGTPTAVGTFSVPVSVYEDYGDAQVTIASGTVSLTVKVPPVTGLAVANNSLSTTGWTETWSPLSGASGYVVDLNGSQVAQVNNTTAFSFNNETPGTSYQVTVAAIVYGQTGVFSAPDTVSTPATTLMAPLVLQHSNVTDSGWQETWSAVYGATGYEVALDGTPLIETSPAILSYNFGGEQAATPYSVTVASVYNGAVGPFSTQDIITTEASPSTLLPAPTGLSHTHITTTGWQETWNAVYGATGYQLDLNGQPIGGNPLSTNAFTLTTATPGTAYDVTVAAVYDGVVGNFSTADSVTTTGPAQQLDRVLTPGWNTLSVPYTLSSTALANLTSILNQATVAYGYSNGQWEQVTTSNVSQLLSTPMIGLYIDWPSTLGSTTVTLTPTSIINPPPTLNLTSGWNLVGPSSISPTETDTDFLAGLPASAIAEIVDPNGNPSAVSNPLVTGANTISVNDGYAYWVYAGNNTASLSGQIPTGNVN